MLLGKHRGWGEGTGKPGYHSRTDTLGIPKYTFFQQAGPVSPHPIRHQEGEVRIRDEQGGGEEKGVKNHWENKRGIYLLKFRSEQRSLRKELHLRFFFNLLFK